LHHRSTTRALFALSSLGLASTGCALMTIHLEEKNFLPTATTPRG
jgi:hypothetical protein